MNEQCYFCSNETGFVNGKRTIMFPDIENDWTEIERTICWSCACEHHAGFVGEY